VLSDDAVGGRHSINYYFPEGKLAPSDSAGVRPQHRADRGRLPAFLPEVLTELVLDRQAYGPHLLHFMTTKRQYHGPAASHLTLYIEPVNGKLRLAAQDIQNKDNAHGLTQGRCGGLNGQFFDSQDVVFNDGKWHCVEAMFKLNSLDMARDKPNYDGGLRGWVDGSPLLNERTCCSVRPTSRR